MLPADLKQLTAPAGWSAVLLANVYFWLRPDTGYVATDSNQFPVLHLWSRGVEEPCYLGIHDLLCRQRICSAYLNGKPIRFDPTHLSMEGSRQPGAYFNSQGARIPPSLQRRQ